MAWQDIIKAKKPDFLDLDGDGNKKEPMSEAAKDVKKQTDDEKYLASLSPQEKKKVLEARKLVSQGIPSNAPTTPRIPQWKQKLHKEYDPKDIIEYEKGYEDRQIKRMLTDIEEWAENFDWNKADVGDPIRFRKYRNEMYHNAFIDGMVYYKINNYFEDLDGEDELVLGSLQYQIESMKRPVIVSNFKLNPELKNNPMKYKNEISQLYRDLTLERMIR
tara:strand:- start:119 stop:772 length:654 start_codon:yes stop_codon:yes gene_type:complete